MENESLDNILNGTSEPDRIEERREAVAETINERAEATAEAAPEATDRPRDEHGRFLPKGDPEPAPEAAPEASATPAPEDESPTVPRKALLDERSKRQTLESQLAELNERIRAQAQPQAQQQPQEPGEMPDPWDDPQGHAQWVAGEARTAAEQGAIQAMRRERIASSAEEAKVKYPDYLEKLPIFERLAEQNPALFDTMARHPNPAEFAYTTAKQHEELSQYGSLEERDAALKAQWEAEALERLKATLPAQSAPPTLSNERNVGSRAGPEWAGPKPLADILQ